MLTFADIRREFRPMLGLAAPLALTELGWLVMGLVDTIMVGYLPESATAIGAVSLGTTLFYSVGIFGSSIMLGLDTLVAQAYGARRLEDCHRAFLNALYFALALAPALMVFIWLGLPFLSRAGITPPVLAQTIPFIKALNWGTLPLVLYFVFRRYLQSMSIVKPIVFALISANAVNLLGNWMLVYGHLGFPRLGVTGSGWSTFISRVYMVLVLAVAAIYYDRKRNSGLWEAPRHLDLRLIRRLLSLGVPAAFQLLLEISAFTATTVLVARLGALPLASHQIAMNVASITFMVPLGIGSAAAVRVGHALGAGDVPAAARAGWMALLFGTAFMSCSALVLFLFPQYIARIYTPQPVVISAGATLLIVAAVFQLFDGVQAVAIGALRGIGNTRTPMLAHLFGYWMVGMPLGAMLCFKFGWGVVGFWTGLCVALVLIGCILLFAWHSAVAVVWSPSPLSTRSSACVESHSCWLSYFSPAWRCPRRPWMIVAKNLAAKGGLAKLKAVQTIRATGAFEASGMQAQFVRISKRPDKVRLDITIQGLNMVRAYDGKNGWQVIPFTGKNDPEPMDADSLKQMQEEADIDGALVDYKQKGHKVELVGKEKIEGTDAYHLKVTLKNGDVRHIYLDAASFLEIKATGKTTARGAEVDFESTVGDYKEVEGMMVPFSMHQGSSNGQMPPAKITITKIEFNVPIDDAKFNMPPPPPPAAAPPAEKSEPAPAGKEPPKPPAATKPPRS